MKYFFGSPTLGFVCGDAEALVFDHFVAPFCSFLLCELSSKNPSNMFLNFGKKCLFFFGLPTLNFVFDGAQALVFGPFFFLVLGPLQSSTEQALNDISLFDSVSQSSEVCGGRLRKEMRF